MLTIFHCFHKEEGRFYDYILQILMSTIQNQIQIMRQIKFSNVDANYLKSKPNNDAIYILQILMPII